jgi:hypothetical protein
MAIILSQITIGDHRIMITDSAPNTGAGITAEIGSMIIVSGVAPEGAIWLKTGSNDTDWKVSTVDKAALDLQILGIENDIAQEILDRVAQDAATLASANSYTDGEIAQEVIDRNAAIAAGDAATLASANSYTDGEIAQEVIDRNAAIAAVSLDLTALQGDLDALDGRVISVESDLAQEILDRAADVDAEESARIAADNALDGRLDIIEGIGEGSVAKAEQDAKDYADAAVLVETNARIAADDALDGRLDVIEGIGEGSVAKAEQDAKDYADAAVAVEAGDRAAEDLTFLKLDGSRPMTGALNMGNHKIEFLHAPENASDAATKEYVDDLLAGLSWKEAVHSATVASENINIANPGTATIGGHLLEQGQRVLLKDQTDLSENGIYIFDTSSTALVRSSDADVWAELEGAVVYVQEGTNAGGKFVATIPPTGVVGVDDITFTMFSAASALDGVGTADTVAIWTDVHTLGSSLVTTQELEYVSGVTSGIQAQIDAEESARISADNALDGRLDIIEGADTVEGSVAKAEKDAKDYADAAVAQEVIDRNAAIAAGDALKVDKAGDTMTGNLVVDSGTGSSSTLSTSSLSISGMFGPTSELSDGALSIADSMLGSLGQLQAGSLNLSNLPQGKNITLAGGEIETSIRQLDLTFNKISTDNGKIRLYNYNGSTYTPILPTQPEHVTTKSYVDAADSALDARLDLLEADDVTKTYVDSQDALKVSKAGDTMSGDLIVDLGAGQTSTVGQNVVVTASDGSSSTVDALSNTIAAGDGLSESSLSSNSLTMYLDDGTGDYDAVDIYTNAIKLYHWDGSAQTPIMPVNDEDVTVKKYVDDSIAALGSGSLTAIQNELDATQLGAGLGTGGSYIPHIGTNYIDGQSSLDAADVALDQALKAEETARIAGDAASQSYADGVVAAEQLRALAAEGVLQDNIDDEASARALADGLLQGEIDAIQDDYGAANGLATLDGGGKVPLSQLPNSIMQYQGVWDASTNTPALADGAGNADEAIGDVYRVSVAGSHNLGSGLISFEVGDYVILNASKVWEKSDTTDAVATVNGYTGNVVLDAADLLMVSKPAQTVESELVQLQLNIDAEEARALAAEGVLQGNIDAEEAARIAADLLKLDLAGGTMSGDINMGSNDLVNASSVVVGAASGDSIFQLQENNVKYNVSAHAAQTTDGTQITMFSETPADNSVGLYKVMVTGIDAANNDSVAYERTVRVKKVSGVVSLGTIQADYTSEDPSLSQCSIDIQGVSGTVAVKVAGVNTKTINWKAVLEKVR